MWPLEQMKTDLELRAAEIKNVTPAPEPTDSKRGDKLLTQFSAGPASPDKKNLLN